MESEDIPGAGGGDCSARVCGSREIQAQSYCNVGKLAVLFRDFNDRKRELVRAIGFDGLLKTPFINALDDEFSMWLMSCLDPKRMVLSLPSGQILPVKDIDAHFVLGIPFRGKDVFHDTRNDKEVVSNVLGKLSIGGQSAKLTMEYLEWVLARSYAEEVQEEEKVAFQIAVVLYSMACFFAGPMPKKGFPIWLLKNFVGPTKITGYNWAGYVLSVLAHGAMKMQEQLRNGDKILKLHGCTFLLQIMYLDNVDFGPFSAVHLDIPRGSVYNSKYLKHLIAMDRNEFTGSGIVEYGVHKLRVAAEVCYSRGWAGPNIGKWAEYDKNYMTTSELLHNLITCDEKLAVMLAASLAKISASQCYEIRRTYKDWYPGYKAVFSPLPEGTLDANEPCTLHQDAGKSPNKAMVEEPEARSSKRARIDLLTLAIEKDEGNVGMSDGSDRSALELLAEEAIKDNGNDLPQTLPEQVKVFVWEDGCEKKLVAEHSKFPKSPFELGRFMHAITWRKKTALLDWLEPGAEDWGHLTRIWVHIDYPVPLSLMGYDLKTQLSAHGSFTKGMVDAITRTSSQYDAIAYGETGSRWRHFLPAHFAEAVLREEDFLASNQIRAHFTGDHIEYPVENCRLLSVPVHYHGRWSCYFWDFLKKRVIVLDPTRMGLDSANVEMHHGHLVEKLTQALFSCIGRFFAGWDFDQRNWRQSYQTQHGPRSKIYNSGLYSILYSRYFDGQQLVCTPNQGGLIEPRSALLYEILTIKGNKVKLPGRIQDLVSKPWLKKR